MARKSGALARGLDVLVATPGRLVDHLDSRVAHLGKTEFFVLDEVDQMLDLGFAKSIRRIVGTLPKQPPEFVLLGDDADRNRKARRRAAA